MFLGQRYFNLNQYELAERCFLRALQWGLDTRTTSIKLSASEQGLKLLKYKPGEVKFDRNKFPSANCGLVLTDMKDICIILIFKS